MLQEPSSSRERAAAAPRAPLGHQVLVDLCGCDAATLDDTALLDAAVREGVRLGRATALESHARKFHPQGVSLVVILAESHVAVHTWPELGRASVDVFTCGSTDARAVAKHIAWALGATTSHMREVDRGA